LGISLAAIAIAFTAMLWLLVLDPRQSARADRSRARGRHPTSRDLMPVHVPSELDRRRPSPFRRLRSLIMVGGLSTLIGFLLALAVALIAASGALLLRSVLG
jgi:hypothetical protein